MLCKGFAVGAALLAALVPPCAARAGVVINLFDSTDGVIISSGPTSFISTGPTARFSQRRYINPHGGAAPPTVNTRSSRFR